jgi:hypothetical protein
MPACASRHAAEPGHCPGDQVRELPQLSGLSEWARNGN